MRMILNKRGNSESVSWPEIMWTILFIVYMGVFFIFIRNSVGGAIVYDEIYAKKIALIIDGARPGSDIKIDVTDAYKIAFKNKKDDGRVIEESFLINQEKNYVKVSLDSSLNGYLYYYFSDYNVSFSPLNIEPGSKRATIIINVREKNGA